MLGNTQYDTFVSARLMYLILGHLIVRDSTCSSLTRSLARLIAISVGVTSGHIWMIASCDRLAPHSTRSVNLMHLVVRSAIMFARMGLYISPRADDCSFPTLCARCRRGWLIIDRLINVIRFVLSILLRTWLSRVKSASDRSRVVRFLERSISVATMAFTVGI